MPASIAYLAKCESPAAITTAVLVYILQSLPYVLFASVCHFVRENEKRWPLIPVIWFVGESIATPILPVKAGYLLVEVVSLSQVAELGGVELLSLIAAMMAFATMQLGVVAYQFLAAKPLVLATRWLAISTLVLVSSAILGQLRASAFPDNKKGEHTKVLVMQGRTHGQGRIGRMYRASRKVQNKADLIVWPECSLGCHDQSLKNFASDEQVLAHSDKTGFRQSPFPGLKTNLIVGGDSFSASHGQTRKDFVSAFLFDPQLNVVGRHDKIELMPGGEFIPGEEWLPVLRRWLGAKRKISRGAEITTLGKIEGRSVGVLLCCEDMAPRLVRKLVADQADLLVSIGNGIAFKSPVALKQHFRIARLRAIESRRYFVRCASHGVSALVAPSGNVLHRLPCQADGAMLVDVPRTPVIQTVYSRIGPVFAWIGCVALGLLGWSRA
jgi:apolipoprotein N-acyltransferase